MRCVLVTYFSDKAPYPPKNWKILHVCFQLVVVEIYNFRAEWPSGGTDSAQNYITYHYMCERATVLN